ASEKEHRCLSWFQRLPNLADQVVADADIGQGSRNGACSSTHTSSNRCASEWIEKQQPDQSAPQRPGYRSGPGHHCGQIHRLMKLDLAVRGAFHPRRIGELKQLLLRE